MDADFTQWQWIFDPHRPISMTHFCVGYGRYGTLALDGYLECNIFNVEVAQSLTTIGDVERQLRHRVSRLGVSRMRSVTGSRKQKATDWDNHRTLRLTTAESSLL